MLLILLLMLLILLLMLLCNNTGGSIGRYGRSEADCQRRSRKIDTTTNAIDTTINAIDTTTNAIDTTINDINTGGSVVKNISLLYPRMGDRKRTASEDLAKLSCRKSTMSSTRKH